MAAILGVDALLHQLQVLESQRTCAMPSTIEELSLRQQFLESTEAASLDVDSVLAEIQNERTDLSELRAALQSRRDRTVSLLNAANLIAGTGLGIAVNALQFSNSTANLGDGIGVGAGIASTVLSVVAIRRQRGPQQAIGAVPNMLAPLFDARPVLNTYYPPEVLRYLKSVPPSEDPMQGTRLDQLKAEWVRSGKLNAVDSLKGQQKIAAVTTSMSPNVKLSIGDLTDRSAMLGDVGGRVALLKRDMASLMRSHRSGEGGCRP